jgi:TonB family protein
MPSFVARLGLAAALTMALTMAQAQPAAAASGPTPSERAQRDADKVFRMILQHADKPRRVPREEAAPAAVAPRAPIAPAARNVVPPATAPSPARPAETRVTTSTPPAVVAEPALPPAAEAPAAMAAPAATVTTPADAAATASPAPAAALAPVTTLAPVAVAAPRSLKLELVSSVEPEFPARLVRSLGRGSVVVHFEVRPDGTVARTEIASSSHRGLNEAAQTAVAAWRFKPISETLPGVVELKFE